MLTNRNIYSAFARQVHERPDAPAILFPEMSLTYDKLNRLALAFASRMSAASVGKDSTITVQSSDPLVVLASLLATSRLGAAFVQDNEGLALPPDLLITHHFHTIEPERTPAAGSVLIDGGWSPSLNAELVPALDADPEKPWLYVFTSGTTGLPKFLALSQRMVLERSNAVAAEYTAERSRFASLMPSNSRTFMARALAALLNGATIVDGKDVEFWQRVGVTMVSGSVAQMLGFFGKQSLEKRIPLAEVFGSRLSQPDAEKLLRSFDAVHDVFGASEANKLFANVSVLGHDGRIQTRGQMLDSSIEIVDIDGKLVAPGASGQVRIRNPYLAAGYVSDQVATQNAFRDGWFYPGDVATWGDQGTLNVFNRTDHILNIGGTKINALIVDQVLRSVVGVRDAVCFQSPKENAYDQLFAFIVLEEGINPIQGVELARNRCREKLPPNFVPHVIRRVAGIPRGQDNLPDRKACADFILEMGRRRQAAPQQMENLARPNR